MEDYSSASSSLSVEEIWRSGPPHNEYPPYVADLNQNFLNVCKILLKMQKKEERTNKQLDHMKRRMERMNSQRKKQLDHMERRIEQINSQRKREHYFVKKILTPMARQCRRVSQPISATRTDSRGGAGPRRFGNGQPQNAAAAATAHGRRRHSTTPPSNIHNLQTIINSEGQRRYLWQFCSNNYDGTYVKSHMDKHCRVRNRMMRGRRRS